MDRESVTSTGSWAVRTARQLRWFRLRGGQGGITGRTEAGPAPATFRSVLGQPGCAALLVASVAGRMPLGMVPIALLLAMQEQAGSLALGGVLAAVYGIAPAAGQPLLGRLADQRGIRIPVLLGAGLSSSALFGLSAAGTGSVPVLVALVIVAGLTCPPLEGGLRSLWPQLLPDRQKIQAAYALDSTMQQIVYVTGPVLAVVLSRTLSPQAALALAAALTLMGSLAFASCRAVHHWHTEPRAADWLGPLRPLPMRSLLLAMVFFGGTVGALDVAAVAAGDRHDAAWLAGALPAAFSLGGMVGGALFVRLPSPADPRRRLRLLAAAFTAAWLPLGLDPAPGLALALVVLPGIAFVPLLTAASLRITALAPPGTTTEAVGWLSCSIRIGLSTATALAGAATGSYSVPLLAAAACALALALSARHHPRSRTSDTGRTHQHPTVTV